MNSSAVQALFDKATREIGKVIVGQQELVEQAIVTLLAGGHALVEGVPGVAKTLAVKTIARWLALDYNRIQGTPDMMPADIVGTSIYVAAENAFSFHRGPAFTQFLLADEINRMPPRTQAALLECMEERHVTSDGVRYDLDPYFTVFATENPIEFEGTYPLPEAQLDRFLLKIQVGYPTVEEERVVLERHHVAPRLLEAAELEPLAPELLAAARDEVRTTLVEPQILDYLLAVVRKTREWPTLSLGASPRAATALLIVAKAYARREGRNYLLPDDVKTAALPCLRHRLQLRPEAELEGYTTDRALNDILAAVAVPQ
jgi:MoxR-like ATPase